MEITTIQQVNDMGCCCPFPECPGNRWLHNDKDLELNKNGYAPFIKPVGHPVEEIPSLYENWLTGEDYAQSGEAIYYGGWYENPTIPGEWGEFLQVASYTFDPDTWARSATRTRSSNISDDGPPFSDAAGTQPVVTNYSGIHAYTFKFSVPFSTSTTDPWHEEDADSSSVSIPANFEVGETFWRKNADAILYTKTDEPHELQGAGGDENETGHCFGVTTFHRWRIDLSGEFSSESFLDWLVTSLESESMPYGATNQTDVPESSTELMYYRFNHGASADRWPLIMDAEVWGEPPDYGMTQVSHFFTRHQQFRITGDALALRYKVGIPSAWEEANAAWTGWSVAHTAWLAADPETRGEEPIEPTGKRSVFECQWEEGFFPQAWEEWQAAHSIWQGDYADWQEAWNDWNEEDPETRGDEPEPPEEPQKPTDPEDRPSKIAEREWTYGGPGASPFSDFFIMAAPDKPGKVRPVNMLIKCYHATAIGVKPTSHGEVIDWTNP
jgi:hypothetical protein